jgi:hypothetical protein
MKGNFALTQGYISVANLVSSAAGDRTAAASITSPKEEKSDKIS